VHKSLEGKEHLVKANDRPTPLLSVGVTGVGLFSILPSQYCIVYGIQKGGRGGNHILPDSHAIVLQQCGQCRRAGRMKGRLIRAQTTSSKRKPCKGQYEGCLEQPVLAVTGTDRSPPAVLDRALSEPCLSGACVLNAAVAPYVGYPRSEEKFPNLDSVWLSL